MADAETLEVLQLFKQRSGRNVYVDVPMVADALGCDDETARQRLQRVVASGYISGPNFAGWDGEWHERGYGVLPTGRDALVEADRRN